MLQNGGQVHDDAEQAVRYVTSGDQWVGGEDVQTMTQKVRLVHLSHTHTHTHAHTHARTHACTHTHTHTHTEAPATV